MRRAVALLASLALLAGCTQVHPVDPASSGVQTDEVNAALDGRKVKVRLSDGTGFFAESVVITRDSTSMTVFSTGRDTVLANSGILTLTFRNRYVGSVLGSAVGVISGVLVGRNNPIYNPEYDGWFAVDRSDAALWTSILGGIVGFVVCGVVGGMIGVNEVFDFGHAAAAH